MIDEKHKRMESMSEYEKQLSMWMWIYWVIRNDATRGFSLSTLKRRWLHAHNPSNEWRNDCFLCQKYWEWNYPNEVAEDDTLEPDEKPCYKCPLRLKYDSCNSERKNPFSTLVSCVHHIACYRESPHETHRALEACKQIIDICNQEYSCSKGGTE